MTNQTTTPISKKTRERNTQSNGEPFTPEQIDAVWQKAQGQLKTHSLIHKISTVFNKGIKQGTHCVDDYGHVIARDEFGQETECGWEIDHIHPVEKRSTYAGNEKGEGSIDDLENLRVLHWKSNATKAANDARIYELEYERFILNKAS